MKKRIFTLLLAALLLLGTVPMAGAAWEDFTDVSGHWAEDFLKVAVADGIVKGYEDNTVRPDAPIRVSEMLAAVNRVLLPQKQADISAATDVTAETWYYEDAAKAVELGLLRWNGGALNIERPASREEIFILMAEAFGLMEAKPDMACLTKYLDTAGMSSRGRQAAASLINRGLVTGFGTSLYPEASIKRAEFLTLLYRMAYYHVDPGSLGAYTDNSAASPADAETRNVSLYGLRLEKDLVITCPVETLSLTDVRSTARVLVRSEALQSFGISGGTSLHELVLAQGQGDLSLNPYGVAQVETLVLAQGGGSVTIGGNVLAAEISGDGRSLTVGPGSTKTLVIGGSGNTVTVEAGAALDSILVPAQAENIRLVIDGTVETLEVKGRNVTVSGTGKAGAVTSSVTATGFQFDLAHDSLAENVDPGLTGVTIRLKAPEKVAPGGTLTVEAQITGVELARDCQLEWLVDGKGQGQSAHTLQDGEYLYRSPVLHWQRNMPEQITVGLKLSYGDQVVQEAVTVPIENYDSAYWDDFEAKEKQRQQEAIKQVSCEYKGNYTLKYVQDNDYSQQVKTDFVNGKGYSSDTDYLIWVNRAYQHVNVFTGKKGQWKLHKEFLCGTGARNSQTPVGEYKTTYKQVGWFTENYTVKPIVRFLMGSGYAFHSRLYYPGTNVLSDASIGFPVSHGCVRMYDEDIQWLYDVIPQGTTVVIY